MGRWRFLVRYAYWTCIVLAIGTEVTAVALYMRYWFARRAGLVVDRGVLDAADSGERAQRERLRRRGVLVRGPQDRRDRDLHPAGGLSAVAHARPLWAPLGRPRRRSVSRNYTARGGFPPHGLWGVWVAVIVAIFSYLSIEMIAGRRRRGQRSRNWPRGVRSVPRWCGSSSSIW